MSSLRFVDIFEAKQWPIDIDKSFDPIDVLNYFIEELGHTQAELYQRHQRVTDPHGRVAIDWMRPGSAVSAFQASQQASTMAS